MVWGAIVGAGISILGAQKQKKADAAANDALLKQTAAGQKMLDQGLSAATSAQNRGIRFADEAFEKALGAAGTIGQGTRNQVLRREEQFRGAADARAADRGLYDSTSALNAQRGVLEGTNATLASIDEGIAGLMAQIHQARGQVGLQGYSGLAGIEQAFAMQKARLETQNVHQAGNIGGAYASAAGSLSKLLMTYQSGGGMGDGGNWWDDADDYASDTLDSYSELA